jgi:tRNA-Thr(GGU) m(6)t(6)A37 methyltransferase TsaA
MTPIGVVRTGRADVEDDGWGDVVSSIELDGNVLEPDATDGLEDFSHIEVFFVFDRVDPRSVCTGARHPRGRTDWPKVGILAQRAKDRPNRLGATTCRLEAVDGLTLRVRGLDAVAGTPVLDIKPYMQGFAPRGAVEDPPWATELMAGYW